MLIEAFRKLAQAITKSGTPEAAFFDAACDEMAESRRRFDARPTVAGIKARSEQVRMHRLPL